MTHTRRASPKQNRTRDPKYLASFEGRQCEVSDCPDRFTTVGAHMSLGSYARGLEAPDYMTAALCHNHHDMADRGTKEERQWVWLQVLKTVLQARYDRWRREDD